MKGIRKLLTLGLACAMLMGSVVSFAPKAAANSFCHSGAGQTFVGYMTKNCRSCGTQKDCPGYQCDECGRITYFCRNCGKQI